MWTARFWRYTSLREEQFDTEAEAFRFLMNGEDYGTLSSDAIIDPDGNITMDRERLSYAYVHEDGQYTIEGEVGRPLLAAGD